MRSHQESIAKTTADTLEDAKIKSSKCKLVKSIKPLVNYKFYLDIERHNILLKIESKIRELGGSIEFFLTKDITHFITDKKVSSAIVASTQQQLSPATIATPQTPLTPNYLSPVVARTPSSNDLKTSSRILTRADAMLYRARKGTCETIENNRKSTATVLTNPSQIAESWGTPVWHTEYALKFLDKVYSYIKERYISNTNSNHHNIKNAQIFKGNYIKIESSQKGYYRPYYKIFNSKWPVINLKPNKNGVFPLTAADENYFYDSEKNTIGKQKPTRANKKIVNITAKQIKKSNLKSDIKMTRKNRSTSKRQQAHVKTPSSVAGSNTATTLNIVNSNKQILSSEKQCGFCEICRVEYDTLTVHLKSETHLNFVKNENNFLALDSLIKSSGTNMDKFLSLNDTNNGNAKIIESITNSDSIVDGTPTATGIHFSPSVTLSKKQRSSTRVSNSTQLKATLSALSAPHLSSQQSLSQKLSQQTAPITFTTYVNRDNKTNTYNKELYHHDQHQIEILEKTTTLGHTRQTRQQSSINQQHQQLDLKIPLQRQQSIISDEQKISDSIIAARAKRQSVKKINYAEPKEDEENSVDELIHGYHRHQRKKKPKLKDKSTTLNVTTKAIKERRSSQSDIKPLSLPLPTSLLYKVVETTTDNSKKIKTSTTSKKYDITSTDIIPAKDDISKTATVTTHRRGFDEQDEDSGKLKEDTQLEKNNKKPSPIIVKIRKVRKSELSILSGEAVNFMFPRRRTSFSEPTDIDRQTTSDDVCKGTYGSSLESSSSNNTSRLPEEWRLTERKTALKRKQLSLSSSLNLNSPSTTATVDVESGNPKKRRRLELNYREDDNDEREEEIAIKTILPIETTIAEENDKVSGNHCIELRSSPRLLLRKNPPLRTYGRRKLVNKHKYNEQETNTKELLKKKSDISTRQKVLNIPSLDNIVNEKLIKYKYAFERVPNNELWYQVFNRQDEGFEKSFEYFGSTVYRKLPYEMGPIRPITKSSCTLCHILSNKTTEITEKKSKSSPKKEKSKNENSSNQQSIASMSIATTNTNKKRRNRKVLNRAAAALINLEMPRKSPREHASTLAILSCLLQRKNAQQQQQQQQQQQKSEQQINNSSCLTRLQQFSPKKNTTDKTEQNNDFIDLNNEICTQISENVKRLRRGEKILNTTITAPTSTTTSSSINSKKNLLELKRKSTKQKKNMRKLASSSASYSRNKKDNLQFEISGSNLMEDRQTEQYINALRLEKDIDEFFTSTISNDDLIMESSQINLNVLGNAQTDDEEKFPEFSQDINLYELIQQQQQDENMGNIRGSKSNKHLFGSGGGGGSVINTFNSSSVYRDINKFRLFKINSTNKKRKNKTGWPTTKRRTTTRQQTRQQKLQQQHEYNKSIKEGDNKEISKVDINSTTTTATASTTITTNSVITVTTMTTVTTDTCNVSNKYSKIESDINDISTNSPITPPESDNDNNDGDNYEDNINNDDENDDDTNHHQYSNNTNNHNHENDCDEDRDIEKTDFGEIISNSRTPNKTIDCRNSTINHSNLSHPYNNHQTLNHHHHHHNHFNQHQPNFSSSDKTEYVSDIFTVSSDSLDTVLDVGSQIKSEDQEEIIAISKCNGKKLNNNQQNHRHNINSATTINNDSDGICNNEGDHVVDDDNDNDDVITATTATTEIATNTNSVLKQKLTSSASSSSSSSLLIRKCSNSNFPNYINNKKLKYSNSMKFNSSPSTSLSSSLSTGELGRFNSMTIANISATTTASSSINCFDTVNNIKFNSRKLSNNSSGKDLKVVVVVKRERNNSISSGSSITNNKSSKPFITTETINTISSSLLSSSDAIIMDANKQESAITDEVSIQEILPTNNNLNNTVNESTATSQITPLSVQTTTISPRRLRKPRGRWYRER